jgi:hypothetical protein
VVRHDRRESGFFALYLGNWVARVLYPGLDMITAELGASLDPIGLAGTQDRAAAYRAVGGARNLDPDGLGCRSARLPGRAAAMIGSSRSYVFDTLGEMLGVVWSTVFRQATTGRRVLKTAPDLADRHRTMANSPGFDGHMAIAEAMSPGGVH